MTALRTTRLEVNPEATEQLMWRNAMSMDLRPIGYDSSDRVPSAILRVYSWLANQLAIFRDFLGGGFPLGKYGGTLDSLGGLWFVGGYWRRLGALGFD